jgi:hypothetical protein
VILGTRAWWSCFRSSWGISLSRSTPPTREHPPFGPDPAPVERLDAGGPPTVRWPYHVLLDLVTWIRAGQEIPAPFEVRVEILETLRLGEYGRWGDLAPPGGRPSRQRRIG